jgi:hypothetical protein
MITRNHDLPLKRQAEPGAVTWVAVLPAANCIG